MIKKKMPTHSKEMSYGIYIFSLFRNHYDSYDHECEEFTYWFFWVNILLSPFELVLIFIDKSKFTLLKLF